MCAGPAASRFQARSKDHEILEEGGQWTGARLTFTEVSPEKIMSREVEAGLRKLDFFRFELFVNSSATDIVFVTLPKHGS